MRSGVLGSMRTWLKYIGRGFTVLTLRHAWPPSSERYRPVTESAAPPRPPPAAGAAAPAGGVGAAGAPPKPPPPAPSSDAYTMFALPRYTSSAIRPSDTVGRPPDSFSHV